MRALGGVVNHRKIPGENRWEVLFFSLEDTEGGGRQGGQEGFLDSRHRPKITREKKKGRERSGWA